MKVVMVKATKYNKDVLNYITAIRSSDAAEATMNKYSHRWYLFFSDEPSVVATGLLTAIEAAGAVVKRFSLDQE